MAMSRSAGSRSFTTRPAIATSPPLISSRPATSRSRVDFPHPEGPRMTMNSPSRMSQVMPWMTSDFPNRLVTFRIETSAMST